MQGHLSAHRRWRVGSTWVPSPPGPPLFFTLYPADAKGRWWGSSLGDNGSFSKVNKLIFWAVWETSFRPGPQIILTRFQYFKEKDAAEKGTYSFSEWKGLTHFFFSGLVLDCGFLWNPRFVDAAHGGCCLHSGLETGKMWPWSSRMTISYCISGIS